MISGSKIRFDWLCRSLLLALACCAAPAWAFDLPDLMGLLSKQKSGEARFTEQRFVHGLEGPLDSRGTLSFNAPDKLVRRTLSPREETMAVEGNTLTLSRGGRNRTLTLDSMPELLGLVEAMRGTLSGDGTTLQRYFRSTVSGSAANWTLDLLPADSRLAAQVRSIRISGRASEVVGLEMEFVGGDRSVMSITPERPGAAGRTTP
ncbi:outer membrane lipoprotein-sorting protein [Variovorax paradoxus]|jgi:outer membrane lipoprotein-sorting protein|uniref:LolA-related protein n=1 Tax=Variovorax paradoxus TaxID=34073 RepID=UPI00277F879B|nr:LolA-related protein [Variovorax paradoxus]MDP9931097.1 outer membrane lipoprotein-sorting protein [Variovorax paradoxus]MDQ0026567.1 outer membrane lipoprotein-sorting protein [Variovorax paradoxus]